ncbi:SDR family NAD(P)-dependent oxidoreductase [Nonomuraea sp. NPDC005650]|uniref:SDR family NAD(P)-dependent oxidoreductase n=1 Tax=Nonomuraea sp. NPDC005650 TaxID=3157045 RepID=UPI0033AB2004
MAVDLTSKVVVITGGTSGIGKAVAERVAADGGAVVIAARREELGAQVAADIQAKGGRALFVRADVTVEADAERVVRAAVTEFGRLDGAFNNVGGVNGTGLVSDIEEASWRADLEQNLTSVFYGLKHQVPAILASGGGSIVTNASTYGCAAIPGAAPYVAAKHGVVGLTRAVALENAERGIRVNALVTGNVDTPLLRNLMGVPLDGPMEARVPNPSGRAAQPEEIAAFVAFLLSDDAAFITGAALAIDGGATAQ